MLPVLKTENFTIPKNVKHDINTFSKLANKLDYKNESIPKKGCTEYLGL